MDKIELQEWKLNVLKDKIHQDKINKLCRSTKYKRMKYMKECVIQNRIINPLDL